MLRTGVVFAAAAGLILMATPHEQAIAASSGPGLGRYYHQQLTWESCPDSADSTISCAIVRVPLSYADPAGRSIRDPATPYSGSVLIHADIPGSRLITLHASVHVPYPGYGNACVNDAVNGYLATGELPASDLSCM